MQARSSKNSSSFLNAAIICLLGPYCSVLRCAVLCCPPLSCPVLSSAVLCWHMAKTDKILIGPQPNVTHNPPRPNACKQVFDLCSTIPMSIITGRLPDSQRLAANERGVEMQSSLICTIMYTHLKLHETSFGALWPKLVPYLNASTGTG